MNFCTLCTILVAFGLETSEFSFCGNTAKIGISRKISQNILDLPMADRKSALKRFNGNNQTTPYPNLVNFRPVISEFTLLKRTIFAAIRPLFDDDLHSSRWRLQTDWKITIGQTKMDHVSKTTSLLVICHHFGKT